MRRRQMLLAASAATTGLAGCTAARERVGDLTRKSPQRRVAANWRPGPGTWAERDYGPANRRHNPHATPPRREPSVDWRQDFERLPKDGWVVVDDDTVFAAAEYRLLALDAADGRTQWERRTDGAAGLQYVDGRLYQVGWDLQNPDLVARSLDGTEQWRTTLPEKIRGVHEQGGYVFVAGWSSYVTLHADTGEVVRERDGWARNLAAADGTVYAAFSEILAKYEVDGRTLTERWRTASDSVRRPVQPVLTDSLVYVPEYQPTVDDGGVRVVDPSGTPRFSVDLEYQPQQLVITDAGPVIVQEGEDGARLLALGPEGERRWHVDVGGRPRTVAADGTVYAGDPLVAVDSESGERLWRLDVDGAVPHAVVDSTLYVGTHDWLAALRA